ETTNVRHPVRVGGRETSEDTKLLGLLPGSSGTLSARNGEMRTTTAPLRIASGPLISPESAVAPQPVAQVTYSPGRVPLPRRNRLFYPSLALLILILVALVSGGVYYFVHKSQGVDQVLQDAQGGITQAERSLSHD